MAPERVVAVFGTSTGVGKTWVAAAAVRALRELGVPVAARKPVQSFEPGAGATDAEVLAHASGEPPTVVCPAHRWYELALAPPVAAGMLGRPSFTVEDLAAEVGWPDGVSVGIVETVGGPRSPVAGDGDSVALAVAVGADFAVLVSRAGLGAINAVRLAGAALANLPGLVVLNGYDAHDVTHRTNREWLSQRDGLDVVVAPSELAQRLAQRPAP